MNFEQAFTALIGNEGNYTLNHKDRGNWTGGMSGAGQLRGTKYGISAASYPAVDIKNLTLEAAKAIYFRDFWNPLFPDILPDIVRFDVFDTAVNSGVERAAKLLQKALGVVADGDIGPKTKAAIIAADSKTLDKRFSGQRLLFITGLPQSQWEAFGKGWVNRIAGNLIND